jgi:hypothetical protein
MFTIINKTRPQIGSYLSTLSETPGLKLRGWTAPHLLQLAKLAQAMIRNLEVLTGGRVSLKIKFTDFNIAGNQSPIFGVDRQADRKSVV